jgi:hypothetical protein
VAKTLAGELRFLDKHLPNDVKKAVERIRENKGALLKAYDKHVLGSYDPGLEARFLLTQPDQFAYSEESIIRAMAEKPRWHQDLAQNLFATPENATELETFMLYAARRAFLDSLKEFLAPPMEGYCWAAVPAVIDTYVLLSEMVLYRLRKKE